MVHSNPQFGKPWHRASLFTHVPPVLSIFLLPLLGLEKKKMGWNRRSGEEKMDTSPGHWCSITRKGGEALGMSRGLSLVLDMPI